jgi:hypothetical protein
MLTFWRVHKIAKRENWLRRACPSLPGLPVGLFVHAEQFSSHWTYFQVILQLSIFLKICPEYSSLIRMWKNNRCMMWRLTYIYDNISLNVFEREIFQTKIAENVKTYILCSTNFSPKIVPFMS